MGNQYWIIICNIKAENPRASSAVVVVNTTRMASSAKQESRVESCGLNLCLLRPKRPLTCHPASLGFGFPTHKTKGLN